MLHMIYHLPSELSSEVYPAIPGLTGRRTVSFVYDTAGRMSSLSSAATSYAASVGVSTMTYAPQGALTSETYASGLIHSITYNTRLQPVEIKLPEARPSSRSFMAMGRQITTSTCVALLIVVEA